MFLNAIGAYQGTSEYDTAPLYLSPSGLGSFFLTFARSLVPRYSSTGALVNIRYIKQKQKKFQHRVLRNSVLTLCVRLLPPGTAAENV